MTATASAPTTPLTGVHYAKAHPVNAVSVRPERSSTLPSLALTSRRCSCWASSILSNRALTSRRYSRCASSSLSNRALTSRRCSRCSSMKSVRVASRRKAGIQCRPVAGQHQAMAVVLRCHAVHLLANRRRLATAAGSRLCCGPYGFSRRSYPRAVPGWRRGTWAGCPCARRWRRGWRWRWRPSGGRWGPRPRRAPRRDGPGSPFPR